jgi:hypothetical protein
VDAGARDSTTRSWPGQISARIFLFFLYDFGLFCFPVSCDLWSPPDLVLRNYSVLCALRINSVFCSSLNKISENLLCSFFFFFVLNFPPICIVWFIGLNRWIKTVWADSEQSSINPCLTALSKHDYSPDIFLIVLYFDTFYGVALLFLWLSDYRIEFLNKKIVSWFEEPSINPRLNCPNLDYSPRLLFIDSRIIELNFWIKKQTLWVDLKSLQLTPDWTALTSITRLIISLIAPIFRLIDWFSYHQTLTDIELCPDWPSSISLVLIDWLTDSRFTEHFMITS